MKTCVHLYLSQFLLEREVLQTNCVEKIKTHFVFSNFLSENRVICDNIGNCCRAGEATDNIQRRMRFAF